MFIKNAIATADSNLQYAVHTLENINAEKVLIPDIQPRNRNIVKNIERWIESDCTVCLLPTTLKGKDVNEIILSGMSKIKLKQIIDENIFSGLRAKIEFQKWKSI